MLRIEPVVFPFAALLLLIIPLPWLCAAIISAVVHEAAHITAILILGGEIQKVRISVGNTKIFAQIPDIQKELLCTLAGPMGSFLLILLGQPFPRLALCGIAQGLFNLIPIYPLDGGRVLHCILTFLFPIKAAFLCQITGDIITVSLLLISIWGAFFLSTGPVPPAIFLLFLYNRKKTCKQTGIGIQ